MKKIQNKRSRQICLPMKQGFTLIELLLVMAIIGILAGTISVGMKSSRAKARVTSTLKTANNINVEMADCYLRNKDVSSPVGGAQICIGAGNYPELTKRCNYVNVSGYVLTIECNSGEDIITCTANESKCVATKL